MENITSKVSCFLRAYHNKTSGFPVFADTAAELLLGDDYEKIVKSFLSDADFFLPGVSGTEEEILGRIINGMRACRGKRMNARNKRMIYIDLLYSAIRSAL